MHTMPRPRIIVSKCLGFAPCRYNGQTVETPFLRTWQEYIDMQPVCPEVESGLGTPRDPIRIILEDEARRLYQPAIGNDVTAAMQDFVTRFLDGVTAVDGFLLKYRSPSCGLKDVKMYRGRQKNASVIKGSGMFGGAVLERFVGYPVEDEGRLRNFTIREHYLTTLFAFADFRRAQERGQIRDLLDFHTRYKLLLMGYNQAKMREMGRLLSGKTDADFAATAAAYFERLKLACAKIPRFPSIINVLQHAFGGFSEHLSKEEKRFFLNSLEEYRDERIPLSAVLHVLRAWAVQHHNDYLLNQAFLTPYPRQLVEITDSGKGRKL